ncbi:MAG: dockerin type I domain-containing protein [Planctomycetota bacterium]
MLLLELRHRAIIDGYVWFKVPGYVSEVVSVPAGATTVDAGLLRCGDANGDNVINVADVMAILRDRGEGGLRDIEVPSTDVNRDGVVDGHDLRTASLSSGEVGTALPNL